MRTEIIEYRGYFIEYNAYGREEYTVDVEGDDIWCNTLTEAERFIDDMCILEEVAHKLDNM